MPIWMTDYKPKCFTRKIPYKTEAVRAFYAQRQVLPYIESVFSLKIKSDYNVKSKND